MSEKRESYARGSIDFKFKSLSERIIYLLGHGKFLTRSQIEEVYEDIAYRCYLISKLTSFPNIRFVTFKKYSRRLKKHLMDGIGKYEASGNKEHVLVSSKYLNRCIEMLPILMTSEEPFYRSDWIAFMDIIFLDMNCKKNVIKDTVVVTNKEMP